MPKITIDDVEVCEALGLEVIDGKCEIDLEDVGKKKEYELYGYTVATDWYGGKGFAKLLIHTDEDGYHKIKRNPLQDYLSFGVASIDYATFDVIETTRVIGKTDSDIAEIRITRRLKPIKAGDEEEARHINPAVEPIEITY